MRPVFILPLVAALLFVSTPAPAEETAPAQKEESATAASSNPYELKARTLAKELSAELSKEEAESLAILRQGFGTIRAVHMVRNDVSKAAGLCSQSNPDIEQDMKARFSRWSGVIDPALQANEKKMQDSLKSGVFKNSARIKTYLDTLDMMAEYSDSKIDKRVVTSEESCKNLMQSLDETEKTLGAALEEILWPQPPKKGAE